MIRHVLSALLIAFLITGCSGTTPQKIVATPPALAQKTTATAAKPQEAPVSNATPSYYTPYLKFLNDVYETMDHFYYRPVSKLHYEIFVQRYKDVVLSKIPPINRIDQIAEIGAGLMVNALKDPSDKFTTFIPPKQAEEYAKKIYGYQYGIGVDGHMTKDGYLIDHIQIRSDAFKKGLKAGDLILKINAIDVKTLDENGVHALLFPALNTLVKLDVLDQKSHKIVSYAILCEDFFYESVTPVPTEFPGVYCLKISSFNKMTSDDLKGYIKDFNTKGIKLLIIDLRDNPGGPPLAVYELSGIFLPAKSKLFFYRKRHEAISGLISSSSQVTYGGPMVILVDRHSGSASEIMSAIFQGYGRALLMGKEPTAGMAFLKSTFKFDDGSMLAMITGDAYLFNGNLLDTSGVKPDYVVPSDVQDLVRFAADKFSKKELTGVSPR